MRASTIQAYIGERLKEERERFGLTQIEMAEAIGLSQPQYSRFERGTREIGVAQLALLAQRLQLPLESFFPTDLIKDMDTSERELLEAWRGSNLTGVLHLVGERFRR